MTMKDELEAARKQRDELHNKLQQARNELQEERYQRRKMERALSAVKWLLQQINAAENFEI